MEKNRCITPYKDLTVQKKKSLYLDCSPYYIGLLSTINYSINLSIFLQSIWETLMYNNKTPKKFTYGVNFTHLYSVNCFLNLFENPNYLYKKRSYTLI